ncbi:dihydrolipoamide dehydrogenase [Pullulanibacillus pueri]|uniref:Dihydrolipoyl dehydrogenase n=1 Tax=Pullulanibacillus pueri TaxID=1437324 RepID=A0A8J2ZVM1_9BACL|nr:dihydrolipoyl dehydrogenase [Pullulanibacillus pueri]MBM7681610.1 dihydrolipoamide dehydrogenase [Pullulanibacillus pueri]GGH79462.1 dihydrolipoyl dehydrogenase [Pullulanibacillus pueri]
MAESYQLVILGGGTGGYVAAIRAAQLGIKTAIIEASKLGGTCLHRGCIPSKALLRSAEVYTTACSAEDYGILTENVSFDFEKVHLRKQKIVEQLHNGVQRLMKKGKIDIYEGHGRILGPSIFSPLAGAISVEYSDGKENDIVIPEHLIIATGSKPRTLPGLEIDGDFVLTSDDAVALTSLPKSIMIVGGGVIGVEWASLFADFGVEVTILEYADRVIPTEDRDISKEMQRQLEKKGITVVTEAKVLPETVSKTAQASIQAEVNGQQQTYSAEKILVSVGRAPNVEDIGLQNTTIKTEKGFILTNEHYQTAESHIYAIGDVIGGLQLAHVASHEGIKAVEHIAGENPAPLKAIDVAKCIYTHPEAASVGLTEEAAKQKGLDIKIGKFPFQAIGKALVHGETDGFVKLIADKKTNDLVGIHMIGPHVTDMISEAALARVLDATPWEVAETIHPHPTLSEVIGEAALAVDGRALHF